MGCWQKRLKDGPGSDMEERGGREVSSGGEGRGGEEGGRGRRERKEGGEGRGGEEGGGTKASHQLILRENEERAREPGG